MRETHQGTIINEVKHICGDSCKATVLMANVTQEFLTAQLNLGEQLKAGRANMMEPQDLPGRFGRVIEAVDRVLQAIDCEAVVGGGWAVWRHGFVARITQDVDIVLPRDRVEEFLRVAAVSGFDILPQAEGCWPKLHHKESDIQVDILPEGATPGTSAKLAPTTIRHPSGMGARGANLKYMELPALVELKLAAGRMRDEFDVTELVRTNMDQVDSIRQHLAAVHTEYVKEFDRLVERAKEQQDR